MCSFQNRPWKMGRGLYCNQFDRSSFRDDSTTTRTSDPLQNLAGTVENSSRAAGLSSRDSEAIRLTTSYPCLRAVCHSTQHTAIFQTIECCNGA